MKWDIQVHDPANHEFMEFLSEKREVSIGRSRSNDIVLVRSSISQLHLRLSWDEKTGIFTASDHDSMNGTFTKAGRKWVKIAGQTDFTPPIVFNLGQEVAILVSVQGVVPAPGDLDISGMPETIKDAGQREAIMVLDQCGSTRLSNEDERIAFHLKKRLETISRFALNMNGASFYKGTGDGFLATFPHPHSCLSAALDTLRLIGERNRRTGNPPLHVRIALHTGTTYLISEDPVDKHGSDINAAFRIEGLTEGNFTALLAPLPQHDRILCTSEFRQAIIDSQAQDDITFVECGMARVKGFDEPLQVFLITQGR